MLNLPRKYFSRRAFLGAAAAVGLAATTGKFFQQAGAVPSAEKENIENWRTKFTKEAQRSQTIEGAIVDRNGEPLTEPGDPGTPAKVLDISYGSLIGLRTAGGELTGLRKTYQEELLYSTLPGKGAGRTLHLTIDSELQKVAYSLIAGTRGTCAVMNARTGSMLACATSRGTLEFDVNHYAELYDVYKREPNFFVDPLITPMAPGSVMKLITASAMLKNGVDMTYYDDGPYHGISNYGKKRYGKLELNSAVVHSSNTYFAHGAEMVGTSNFLKEAGQWGFADAVPAPTVIPSYEGTALKSSLGLQADSSEANLRQIGFGQGSALVTPIQVFLWYSALALNNDEAVGAPHIVDYIEDPNTVEDAKYIETRPALPAMFAGYGKTQETLRAAFAGAAEAYKLKNDKLKAIYGKTGTATQPDGKNTTLLAFSFITQRKEAYAAIITRSGTDKTSAILKEPARALLKHTLEVIE